MSDVFVYESVGLPNYRSLGSMGLHLGEYPGLFVDCSIHDHRLLMATFDPLIHGLDHPLLL